MCLSQDYRVARGIYRSSIEGELVLFRSAYVPTSKCHHRQLRNQPLWINEIKLWIADNNPQYNKMMNEIAKYQRQAGGQ
jgi:hypothetical protein